jgi:adenine-specific DNA-methyltransferase
VCDAFSGTTAVSIGLKQAGYLVACNDINLFSYYYGRAFVANSDWPDAAELPSVPGMQRGVPTSPGTSFRELLRFLNEGSPLGLPSEFVARYFWDTYTEEGTRSAFVSARGRTGRRRFFTADNARRLDTILGWLRYWRQHSLISEDGFAMVICCVLDAVERVSNTQGTYHDFPRQSFDPRAFGRLLLLAPEERFVSASPFALRSGHIVGKEEDSLDFISTVPHHRVLYLDPPYNFRQYTSYYFLPNVIARYADIEDLEEYFSKVKFVRGQNPDDDFTSTFSLRSSFLESMKELIVKADCDYVVISYFDGRNHWSDVRDGDGLGQTHIAGLLGSGLFEPNSLRVSPITRLNYQSYGGYLAEDVSELVFIARKRTI